MPEPSQMLVNLLFAALLFVFLGLYVAGIAASVEPEIAMLRAGAASLALAVVGRLTLHMIESAPPTVPIKEEEPTSAEKE